MSDSNVIIQSIANGNKAAFKALYCNYSDKVYNIALSYIKNVEDAEEITQDVFVKIYKYASTFKGDASVSTWIYRITVNTSLNYVKKKDRKIDVGNFIQEVPKINFNHPGILLENKENGKALFNAMDTLPDNQRMAFILSYIEDLPRQEVANIMQTTLKAVESLLQRSKNNLRISLKKVHPHRRNLKNQKSK